MATILFIGLSYYSYTQRIIGSLRGRGHSVTFYPIESPVLAAKAAKRCAPDWYVRARNRYHERIVETVENVRFDRVIFLQPHHFSHENIYRLRSEHREAKFNL